MSSGVTFRPQNVEAIRRGPVDFLLSWIQSPDVDGLRALANHLPFMFAPAAQHFTMDPTADLAREAALRLLDPDRVTPAGDAGTAAWWWSAGSVGCLTRTSAVDALEVALVIDDRTEKLADKDQAADGWREWLRISNALNLREQPTIVTALTDASVQGVADHAKHGTVPDKDAALPPEWQRCARPHHQQRGADLHRKARPVRDAGARRNQSPFPSWGTRRRTAYPSISPGRTSE